jgi:hypothetical protein
MAQWLAGWRQPHDRLRHLPRLVNHLTFLIVAPYIGSRSAIESIETAGARIDQHHNQVHTADDRARRERR